MKAAIEDIDKKSGIKTIAVEPEKYYRCQQCSRIFKSDKDREIIPGIKPLCSNRCKFRKIYYFIKRNYERKDIIQMWKHYFPETKFPNKTHKAVYKITKENI